LSVGLGPNCVKAALTNFIYFFLLRLVRPLLGRVPLLQGMGAGVGVQLIILPVDMIVTRLQSTRGSLQNGGFAQALRQVVKQHGLFGLWAGLGPGMALTLNPGITQMVLARLGRGRGPLSAAQSFWFGAAAKAVASMCTYPYTRAKVQMQIQGSGTTMMQVLTSIIGDSGLLALFDGLGPQLFNGVLKEAILNMIRVKIAVLVAQILRLLQTDLRKRVR